MISLLLAGWPLHRDFLVKKKLSAVKTDKVYSYVLILQYLATKHAVSLSLSGEVYWESFPDSIVSSTFLASWA